MELVLAPDIVVSGRYKGCCPTRPARIPTLPRNTIGGFDVSEGKESALKPGGKATLRDEIVLPKVLEAVPAVGERIIKENLRRGAGDTGT